MLLTVVFSNHCQMDCAYCCIQHKNESPILSVQDIKSFIDKNLPSGHKDDVVEFFGGEPTLHWSSIKEIMDIYPDMTFRIYTNGLWDQIDGEYWDKFDEILFSLDGTFEMNHARKNSLEEYNKIVDNLKWLINRGINPGIAIVIGNDRQFKNLLNTIRYFEDIGVKYFSLEVATVWEDDQCIGLDKNRLFHFVLACMYLLNKSLCGDLRYLNFPRELISSEFYFKNRDGSSCADTVRAISPRGNIYLCRDHAANEESLIKKSTKVKTLDEVLNDYKGLTIRNNSFDHLKRYDKINPCPVKAHQYEQANQLEKLWWTQGDIQENILQMLWIFNDLNSVFIQKVLLGNDIRGKDINISDREEIYNVFESWVINIINKYKFKEIINWDILK